MIVGGGAVEADAVRVLQENLTFRIVCGPLICLNIPEISWEDP